MRHLISHRLRDFLAELIDDIDPSARLVEFCEVPDGRYALRVDIPREQGKRLFLFRGLIDQALTNPGARTLVRSLLRAEVLHLGAQRSISDTRRVRFERTSLTCALCSAPIVGRAGVVFHFGVMAHRGCVGRTPEAPA